MQNLLEILEWDSSFFGYQTGRINAAEMKPEKLSKIVIEAKKKNTRLIYLFADPADKISQQTAEINGARLVDQKVTFHKQLTGSQISETDIHINEFEQDKPSKQLINLSLQSGLYSRYKVDIEFKNNEFEKLYMAWIENSVNKKIADHIFVYKEDEVELGFVTLKVKDNYGEIGLIAVDESARGRSIGMKLTAAVINHLYRHKIADLQVATQLENILACKFYKKAGFNEMKIENIYHIWL